MRRIYGISESHKSLTISEQCLLHLRCVLDSSFLFTEVGKQNFLQESFAYVSVANSDAGEKIGGWIRRIVFDFVYLERRPEEIANVPQVLDSEEAKNSGSNYRTHREWWNEKSMHQECRFETLTCIWWGSRTKPSRCPCCSRSSMCRRCTGRPSSRSRSESSNDN